MAESFGRIVTIIISVYLMIIAPVQLLGKQSGHMSRMYAYGEAEQFCEAVRNTGKISPAMYEELMRRLYGTGVSYTILIEHMTQDNIYYGRDDILDVLKAGDIYHMSAGDYIRVALKRKEPGGMSEYIAFCGGMIKDEDN